MVVLGDSPCGCDVELDRAVPERALSRVSAAEERRSFSALEIWTLKESAVKLVGEVPGGDVYRFMANARFERVGGKILCQSKRSAEAMTAQCGDFQVAMMFEGEGSLPGLREIGERALFGYEGYVDVER
ncbi:4-phosphopantetheinyl transferase family protein [Adlercreutzia sp. ZJ473]|uniref:4-phosphopantetheinyl transferase family protein n=1 Tax=Adlercreutzia sp. ZJ473 TaxID=2722822 RepID=UPI001556CE11|nr:4-phosphopantetheinyl transferase family protein [Adlercreutzia sp. ZJ473]